MFKGKKAALYTLGCKLNFSETSSISRQLQDVGFIITDFNKPADLYVINTCSVTENANRECKRIIRKARRNSSNCFIVATGCFAQLKPKEIASIDGVDMVLGANEKFNLPKLLKSLNKNQKSAIHGCEINNLNYFPSYSLKDRTRSFLKIQDGCNYPCTYCTIPLARGNSRSDSIRNIINIATKIASKGIKEIVLTGVNIGDFKDKENNQGFDYLIKELDNVVGIDRYRISSIEPNLISKKIIQNVKKSKKFMPHFHIPLQSGSNTILGKMRRRYRKELYAQKIHEIVSNIPNVSIGADVIVGFPGENDQEFDNTLKFIKSLPLSYLHVFSYSERENTQAINFKNKIDKTIKKERSRILRILSEKMQRDFYQKYVGKQNIALFEQENHDGFLYGFTENYIKVKIPFNIEIIKTQQKIQLLDIDSKGIMNAKLTSHKN